MSRPTEEEPDMWQKLWVCRECIGAKPKPFTEQMPTGALEELSSMVTLL